MRGDGRLSDEMRPLTIERDYTRYAHGSVLIRAGETRVICTAMVENGVPQHCRGRGRGWLSAEYCMLPSANPIRKSLQRPAEGRAREIQRLIGRSLRAAVDLQQIGDRTIWIDCDVIQADGGTRTASITGGYVALVDALRKLKDKGNIESLPIKHYIAAVSVGIVDGLPMLDLTAAEDSRAAVDMNVVMTHEGRFIELQGTAEAEPFGTEQLEELLELGAKGMFEAKCIQTAALGGGLRGQ